MSLTKNSPHASHGLTFQIMLALGLGLLVGSLLNYFQPGAWAETWLIGGVFDVGGRLFVSLLKLLVVPLVFVSLVVGTASLEDVRNLGRIGLKTLGLYLATTVAAITLAVSAGLLFRPGTGLSLATEQAYQAKPAPSFADVLVNIVPTNPLKAMVEGEMLQIIFFAIFFGLALALSKKKGERVLHFFQELDQVILLMVSLLVRAAPYGVFCLIARVFAVQGFGAILPLGKYFFLVLAVLLVHWLCVYPALLSLLAGLNPLTFFRKFRGASVFAFSTSSSNATIPVTLELVTERLGVHNSVASFTVPLGATINMDGTAIMQGLATVFIAQLYGIDIGLSGYLMVILTATLASIGTAGVPGVGLVTLAMVLRQVNLPTEGIALIIGIDRLLDMARTVVNVTGDAVVSCIVAKSEGKLDLRLFRAEAAELP